MAEPYATYDQLVLGWPDGAKLPGEGRAEEMLARASRLVSSELSRAGIEPDGALLLVCRDVVCQMVTRACAADGASYGATQGTVTNGSFSRSSTWASPVGDLYLSKAERRALGLSRARIGSVRAANGLPEVGADG